MRARDLVLARLERSIAKRGYPRTVLSLILFGCGLLGLVLSIAFNFFGLSHMGVRYLVCFALSYALFLGLLRLWASRGPSDFDPGLDLLVPEGDHADGLGAGGDEFAGGGGDFGGGGASSSWEGEPADCVPLPTLASAPSGGSSAAGAAGTFDLDEGWILTIPLVLVAGGVLAAGYVVSGAPILVAEVALDLAIAAGAYRRAARLDPQYWIVGAFRRTWLAALGLALLLGVVGFALQAVAPNAHSIGEALAAW